jgi:hypothetical protein
MFTSWQMNTAITTGTASVTDFTLTCLKTDGTRELVPPRRVIQSAPDVAPGTLTFELPTPLKTAEAVLVEYIKDPVAEEGGGPKPF